MTHPTGEDEQDGRGAKRPAERSNNFLSSLGARNRALCPTEEEMVDGYYSGEAAELQKHLTICPECNALYRSICEALDTASEARVPERGVDYGARVWARVSAQLPVRADRRAWARWMIIPAAAGLLGLVFAGGMWTERIREPMPTLQVKLVHAPAAEIAEPQAAAKARTVVAAKARGSSRPRPVHVMSDAEQDAKLLMLNSLLEADAKRGLPEVLAVVNGKTSDRTKEHALFVLAQSDSAEAREALMKIARDAARPELQTKAVRMMGMISDDGARKELAGLYRTASNPALKREILNGLMFSGSKTTLLKVARTEADPDLRNSAIANLSITTVPEQVTIVPLRSAPIAEKKQILSSVFLAGDSQVMLDVLKRQPDAAVRVATIRSLAVMGEQSKVLVNVYRTDSDEEVRRAVLDALVVQQNGAALSELAREEADGERKKEILSRVAMIRAR